MKRASEEGASVSSLWRSLESCFTKFIDLIYPQRDVYNPWWLPGELWNTIRHIALLSRHWDEWKALWVVARSYSIERLTPGIYDIEFVYCQSVYHDHMTIVVSLEALHWNRQGQLFGVSVRHVRIDVDKETNTATWKLQNWILVLCNMNYGIMNDEIPRRVMLRPMMTCQDPVMHRCILRIANHDESAGVPDTTTPS